MSIEKYVRATQLVEQPKNRPERSATVRPGARLATGGTAVVRPQAQLPFKLGDYAIDSGGGDGGAGVTDETPNEPQGPANTTVNVSGSGRATVVVNMTRPWHTINLSIPNRVVGSKNVTVFDLYIYHQLQNSLPNVNGGSGSVAVAQILPSHGNISMRKDISFSNNATNVPAFANYYNYDYISPNKYDNDGLINAQHIIFSGSNTNFGHSCFRAVVEYFHVNNQFVLIVSDYARVSLALPHLFSG